MEAILTPEAGDKLMLSEVTLTDGTLVKVGIPSIARRRALRDAQAKALTVICAADEKYSYLFAKETINDDGEKVTIVPERTPEYYVEANLHANLANDARELCVIESFIAVADVYALPPESREYFGQNSDSVFWQNQNLVELEAAVNFFTK